MASCPNSGEFAEVPPAGVWDASTGVGWGEITGWFPRCLTHRRQSSQLMSHAVDVAEPDATSAKAKAGRIWAMFASEEAAKAWAAKKVAEGYKAIVVTTTLA